MYRSLVLLMTMLMLSVSVSVGQTTSIYHYERGLGLESKTE